MEFKRSLFVIKILVIVSIIASIGSLFTSTNIYPFLSYKLYTNPLGSKNTYSQYRIYSKSFDSNQFHRNAMEKTEAYDLDSYYYMINYLTGHILDSTEETDSYKRKLLLFAKIVVPNQSEYKIVEETFRPSDILKGNIQYDTITVVTF